VTPAWQRGLIQRAGRLILIKSVITARRTHQMLVAEAPAWLLQEIASGLRAFFWVGKKKVNGGQCLVAWDKICKPTKFGGLGVKNLELQGLALRVRWEWLRRTDPLRPWQGLPMAGDREARDLFCSLAAIEIGSGARVMFWSDRWIWGRTVAEIAPLLVTLVPTRVRNRRTVEEARMNNAWILDCQGNWPEGGGAQCVWLWVAISEINMDETRPDNFSWKGATSGKYSARDTYNLLCQGQVEFGMAEPIWRSHAPLKCKIFGWLALKRRLWTSDRRTRHGLQDRPDPCATCLQDEDNVDHILAQCPYAKMVWFGCLRRMGLQLQEPQENTDLERWWTEARKRLRKEDRRGFDTFVLLIAWMLWKQRNARVFGNLERQLSTTQIIDTVFEEFSLWRAARVGDWRGMM
jgi:hypothetical protein